MGSIKIKWQIPGIKEDDGMRRLCVFKRHRAKCVMELVLGDGAGKAIWKEVVKHINC